MSFPTESWDFVLLNILLDKLIPSLREKFEAEHRKTEIPHYEQLTKFLQEYCRVFASMSDTLEIASKQGTKSQSSSSKHNTSVASFVTNTASCTVQGAALYYEMPSIFKISSKGQIFYCEKIKIVY